MPAIAEEDESNSQASESQPSKLLLQGDGQNDVSREVMNRSEADKLLDLAARSSLNSDDIEKERKDIAVK